MTDTIKYVFDFVGTRIDISALSIRRRLDAEAFCSVTLPLPIDFVDLIAANPTGTMLIKRTENDGSEIIVGTYALDQVLTTDSPSAFTVVLNGRAAFGTDLATSGNTFVIDNPITDANDSQGLRRFSAPEEATIVVGDTVTLQGDTTTVESISLFVAANNSRMDVSVS